jgi:hypothetical protein
VIIFNETTIMDANTPQQQPTSDTLAHKNFDAKWYGRDNPFYYVYSTYYADFEQTTKPRELYRSFTEIWLNQSSICFIGEAHVGPTRMLDFHVNEEPLTIIMEAGNKLYREATTVKGLWLREPYFAYWYKRNQLTDCMKSDMLKEIVDKSVPYKDNFNFIPIDYRESVMDCPLFAPYFAMVWILHGSVLKNNNDITIPRINVFSSFIPKSLNVTIEELRASKYYNEALPEAFYTEILQRYNYSDLNQFKENINKITELNAIEFLNQVTFHKFDEHLNRYNGKYVRAYFENYKLPTLLDYYNAVSDIASCIEIFEAIDRGDKKIIVYTGAGHNTALLMWFTTVFHDRIIKSARHRDQTDNIAHIIDALNG